MDIGRRIQSNKNQIVDTLYLGLAGSFLPAMVMSWVRSGSAGISYQEIVNWIIVLLLVVVFFLRARIPTHVKTCIIVLACESIGLSNAIARGLGGMMFLSFATASVFIALFFRKRYLFVSLLINVAVILLIMRLYLTGVIQPVRDYNTYLNIFATWLLQLLSFFVYTLMASLSVNEVTGIMEKSALEAAVQENRYRLLVENLDNLVFSMDAEGRLLTVNQAFSQLGLKTSDMLIGRHYSEIIKEEGTQDLFQSQFENAVAQKEKTGFQLTLSVQGHPRIFNVSIIPMYDANGSDIKTILATALDITDLLHAQAMLRELLTNEKNNLERQVEEKTRELKKTLKELMEKEKLASLGGLVAGVAHEINTPLGVAITASTFLSDMNTETLSQLHDGSLSHEDLLAHMNKMNDCAGLISKNLGRAGELVRNFKRISVDQSSENEVTFHIKAYIETTVALLCHEYKNTKYSIQVLGDERLQIKSYPGVFSQIITNLLMNSLIHGFDGMEQGDVEITIRTEGKQLVLVHADNGTGMTQDVLDHIFEPFFTTSRNKGGSGLGMSIVYNLVNEKLHGRIGIESSPSHGTRTTIRVPIEADAS